MTERIPVENGNPLDNDAESRPLVYRQRLLPASRIGSGQSLCSSMLLSGLQIFNAHPVLYVGKQSGFQFQQWCAGARCRQQWRIESPSAMPGFLAIVSPPPAFLACHGRARNWSSGVSRPGQPSSSYRDLATGHVVHFFFAWILVLALAGWLVGSLINGHLKRDIAPKAADIRNCPRDIADHARLRSHHRRDYNTLKKLTYGVVLLHVIMPTITS